MPSMKKSASRAGDSGLLPALHSPVIPVTSELVVWWLSCQALGITGSVLHYWVSAAAGWSGVTILWVLYYTVGGILYCGWYTILWVRYQVWSATSTTVWWHVQFVSRYGP